jgi:Rhs element Vgr protein
MIASRTIPTISGVAQFKLLVNGTELPNTTGLLSVQIHHAINKIPSAILVLLDNSPTGEPFALSNGDLFLPGNTLEIKVGDAAEQTLAFSGFITTHQMRLRASTGPELHVHARHLLSKATLKRKNMVCVDATDADNISAILQPYLGPVPLSVDATTVSHPEMVQFNATDWDFVLSRARAAGLLLMVQPDAVEVKKPVTSGTATYTLNYGSSLIDLDAEIDGRNQYAGVSAHAWDAAQQTMIQQDGVASVETAGDLSASDIAGAMAAQNLDLVTGGMVPENELKAWADASAQQLQLSKLRGRALIDGLNDFRLGGLVTLAGTSNRFAGNCFISAIGQTYDTANGWKTHLQFGDQPSWWLAEQSNAHTPTASALLPAVPGLQIGMVQALADPMGEGRVQVIIPVLGMSSPGVWARIAQADAGNNRGLFFRPEIGDEVVIGFFNNDPRYPVVLGGLHSSANTPPIAPADDNHQKGLTSRSGITWLIDDDKKELIMTTPGGNKITLSDDAQSILLEDMNGNKIDMKPEGITLQTQGTLTLTANELAVSASSSVAISASSSAELKASGNLSVQASGTLELKGAMVNIN